jgi:F-type H+-transporting ATPase subunit b
MDDLNIAIIIAQLINFWLLFFIFYHFLGKKIIETIEERRIKLKNLDSSDDVVREKMEAAEAEVQEIINEWKSKALEIQQNAEEISKKNTKHQIEEAETKAKWIVEAAKRDLEKERLSMLEVMREKVLNLSLKINSKVFDNNDINKEFINKEVKLCLDKTS